MDNGSMANVKDVVHKFGQMDHITKAIGKIIWQMVRVD